MTSSWKGPTESVVASWRETELRDAQVLSRSSVDGDECSEGRTEELWTGEPFALWAVIGNPGLRSTMSPEGRLNNTVCTPGSTTTRTRHTIGTVGWVTINCIYIYIAWSGGQSKTNNCNCNIMLTYMTLQIKRKSTGSVIPCITQMDVTIFPT